MNTCLTEGVLKRGSQANGKDNTEVVQVTHTCFRKSGHIGPHRNGKFEWYGSDKNVTWK